MAKNKSGGAPHPHLDHPKNFPGDMPMPAINKMFGGKRVKPHEGEHKEKTKSK